MSQVPIQQEGARSDRAKSDNPEGVGGLAVWGRRSTARAEVLKEEIGFPLPLHDRKNRRSGSSADWRVRVWKAEEWVGGISGLGLAGNGLGISVCGRVVCVGSEKQRRLHALGFLTTRTGEYRGGLRVLRQLRRCCRT